MTAILKYVSYATSIGVVLIVGMFLCGCTQQQSQQQTANTVSIKNFGFEPKTLTIKVGANVTWINDDTAPHQIQSETFSSELLNEGDSFQFTFNTTGSFAYICKLHLDILGSIIVE